MEIKANKAANDRSSGVWLSANKLTTSQHTSSSRPALPKPVWKYKTVERDSTQVLMSDKQQIWSSMNKPNPPHKATTITVRGQDFIPRRKSPLYDQHLVSHTCLPQQLQTNQTFFLSAATEVTTAKHSSTILHLSHAHFPRRHGLLMAGRQRSFAGIVAWQPEKRLCGYAAELLEERRS